MTKRNVDKIGGLENLKLNFKLNEEGELLKYGGRWGKVWYVVKNVANTNNGYCATGYGNVQLLYHNVVYMLANNVLLDTDSVVDHEDRNKLNNHPSNLKLTDKTGNAQNSKRFKGGGRYNKKTGNWYTGIFIKGKSIHIGNYSTEHQAAKAYKIACSFKDSFVNSETLRFQVNEVLTWIL